MPCVWTPLCLIQSLRQASCSQAHDWVNTAWPLQGTGASRSLQGEGGMGQNPLDKFVRQMALIREATITPSGMDEQLR